MTLTGDIKIRFDADEMAGEFIFEDNGLVTDEGLGNAVLISVFTDKRARVDQRRPDPDSNDLRGWWGDSYQENSSDADGSHIWLLFREKTEAKVISRCEQYLKECLQWLIDDHIVGKIEVLAERQGKVGHDRLGYRARIYRVGENEPSVDFYFQDLWDATFT